MSDDYMETEETTEQVIEDYDEDELDNLDFATLFGEPDAEDDLDVEQGEEETVEEGTPEPTVTYDPEAGSWIDTSTGEKLLPQSSVNEIIGSARIKGREIEESARALEQMTGRKLPEIMAELRAKNAQDYADTHMIDTTEAQRIIEDREARSYLENQLLSLHNQQQLNQQQLAYSYEKSQYIEKPIVKQFERQIDELSQGGQRLSWVAAMNYVLGQNLVDGQVKQTIQNAATRRVNQQARPGMAPLTGAGGAATKSVPKEVAYFAKAMGVDPRESFVEFEKIQKEKLRGH